MTENKCGSVVVLDDKGKLVGIFTERDVSHSVVAQKLDPTTTKVVDHMSDRVAVGNKKISLQEAGELMHQNRIRHLPIVEDGEMGRSDFSRRFVEMETQG